MVTLVLASLSRNVLLSVAPSPVHAAKALDCVALVSLKPPRTKLAHIKKLYNSVSCFFSQQNLFGSDLQQ